MSFSRDNIWGHFNVQATHLSAVTTPRLSSLAGENRQALLTNSFLLSILCPFFYVNWCFSHLVLYFAFFLSLYLNIYLVACCIVDWECLTNVQAATDFKESSHNTHSLILIMWTQKISCIMHYKDPTSSRKFLEKRLKQILYVY